MSSSWQTNRWPNRDPWGELGFETVGNRVPLRLNRFNRPSQIFDGPNLYVFVRNDSENGLDPLGLSGYWSCVGQVLAAEAYSASCAAAAGLSYLSCSAFLKQGDVKGFLTCLGSAGACIKACSSAANAWQSAYNNGCIGLPPLPPEGQSDPFIRRAKYGYGKEC